MKKLIKSTTQLLVEGQLDFLELLLAGQLFLLGALNFSFYPPQIIYFVSGLFSVILALLWRRKPARITLCLRAAGNLFMLFVYAYSLGGVVISDNPIADMLTVSYSVATAGALYCFVRTVPQRIKFLKKLSGAERRELEEFENHEGHEGNVLFARD